MAKLIQPTFFDLPSAAANADPSTSHEAAAEMDRSGARGAQMAAVLAMLKKHPGKTSAELAMNGSQFGELVMNDCPCELKKHMDFVMKARGRALVTGLGLGCVVRGLLAVGRCDTIDLVERDSAVIELAAASVRDRRVRIHHADARDWLPSGRFDYGWHDLWSDPDKDEPHLQRTHFELMAKLIDRVPRQGAWAMPRRFTRRIPEFRLRGSHR